MAAPTRLSAIGILGGTFDPVHFGHLRAATEFAEAFALQEVRLLPCHIPVHRGQPVASNVHRQTMLQLALANKPNLLLDTSELASNQPSYTIDSLRHFRQMYGEEIPLYFAVGVDAFNAIETWKDWQQLFELANFVIMSRPAAVLNELPAAVRHRLSVFSGQHHAASKIYQLTVSGLDISSSQIRQMASNHRSIAFLLPETVENYIHQHKLYQ